jgi:hypothetical protein
MQLTGFQEQLKTALLDYFQAIEKQKNPDPSQRPPLREHFIRLDTLAAQLPRDCDSQLRHYMTQKSYEKALNLLSGLGSMNVDGNCSR